MTGHTSAREESPLVAELAAVVDALLDFYLDIDAGFQSVEEQDLVERAARLVEQVARAGGPAGGARP